MVQRPAVYFISLASFSPGSTSPRRRKFQLKRETRLLRSRKSCSRNTGQPAKPMEVVAKTTNSRWKIRPMRRAGGAGSGSTRTTVGDARHAGGAGGGSTRTTVGDARHAGGAGSGSTRTAVGDARHAGGAGALHRNNDEKSSSHTTTERSTRTPVVVWEDDFRDEDFRED